MADHGKHCSVVHKAMVFAGVNMVMCIALAAV